MNIQTLDYKKYKRFFAFGCSFTNYKWTTWADIIGREIPVYENWGAHGAGNQFIFNSIIECHRRNKLGPDDLCIVMWTSPGREDRYVNNKWTFAASTDREQVYGKDWFKKFGFENKGLVIRDYASIDAAHIVLESTGADWTALNSIPLVRFNNEDPSLLEDWVNAQVTLSEGKTPVAPFIEGPDVIQLYKHIFTQIKKPMLTVTTKIKQRNDQHPSPEEALEYLNEVLPNNLPGNVSAYIRKDVERL